MKERRPFPKKIYKKNYLRCCTIIFLVSLEQLDLVNLQVMKLKEIQRLLERCDGVSSNSPASLFSMEAMDPPPLFNYRIQKKVVATEPSISPLSLSLSLSHLCLYLLSLSLYIFVLYLSISGGKFLIHSKNNGSDFMRKQELIDAAEASGLSRPGQFGSSPKDCCPAKYMLTEEGKEAARECLLRTGLVDLTENWTTTERLSNLDASNILDLEFAHADMAKEVTLGYVNSSSFLRMRYSKEQILCALTEVSETSQNKEISSLWPAVLCHLREEQVYGLPLKSHKTLREDLDLSVIENSQMESNCSGSSPSDGSPRREHSSNLVHFIVESVPSLGMGYQE
ncbi:Crossover junction endonuclease MUS81, partial [Camellia lanceoleosa]